MNYRRRCSARSKCIAAAMKAIPIQCLSGWFSMKTDRANSQSNSQSDVPNFWIYFTLAFKSNLLLCMNMLPLCMVTLNVYTVSAGISPGEINLTSMANGICAYFFTFRCPNFWKIIVKKSKYIASNTSAAFVISDVKLRQTAHYNHICCQGID